MIEQPDFNHRKENSMKDSCQKHCFSTFNHNLGYCCNDTRVIRWLAKQAMRGFQGPTGSFE